MGTKPSRPQPPIGQLISVLQDTKDFEKKLATNSSRGDALSAALLDYAPRVENKRNAHWLDRFLQLYSFFLEYGRLPRNKDDSSLYQWVKQQKTDSDLPLARKELLNFLPTWQEVPNARWTDTYEELQKEVSQTGKVPPHLYEWQRMQKIAYRKGELEKEKIDLLNEVPRWTWLSVHEKSWIKHAKKMVRFISQEQRWPTPNEDRPKIENKLYHWWYRQGKNTDPRKQLVIDRLALEKKHLQQNLPISEKKALMKLIEQARRDMENNPEKRKSNGKSTTET